MLRIFKLLFLYLVYQLVFLYISTGVYTIVENGSLCISGMEENSKDMMVIMVSQFLSTLALGVHLLAGKYVSMSDFNLHSENKLKTLFYSVAFILGMSMWTNYFSEMIDLPDYMKNVFLFTMKHPLGVLSIVILAPVVEELLFRGAIQGYMIKKYGNPYFSIFVSSLIFGLIHANPAQIPFAFILGLSLGWMYYITGSLIPSILMHFVNNGSAVLLSFIYESPDASITSCFGQTGAVCISIAGIVISVLSVLFIKKDLVTKTIQK